MKTMKFKKLFSLLLVIIMTIAVSVPASATTSYGYGFASRPITIYAGSALSAIEKQQLQEAIAVWNSTGIGSVLQYGGTASLLSYYWLSDGKNGVVKGDLGNNVTAVTSTKTNGSNIIEADISLNTKVTYNNGSTQSGKYYLKSVFIHELGHVLGIADNSDSSSVMYHTYTGRTGLNANDITDLDNLY